jgi:hypothetical protein
VSTRYVIPRSSRAVPERVDGVEQLRIPMRRSWFTLLFLSFWLCMWTIGGLGQLATAIRHMNPASIPFLIIWVLGWLFAASTIVAQVGGSEIVRVVGRDLEISRGVGPLRRRKLYRGDLIRYLDSSDPNPMGWPSFLAGGLKEGPLSRPRSGAIKFDYGADTIYAAGGVDEADGRTIVEWLRPKLPRSAVDKSI